ncbi:MAG: DUF3078 domain-containing protein [Bacteroidota bacterium]
MKNIFFTLFLILGIAISAKAQTPGSPESPADTSYWKKGMTVGLNFTNTGFSGFWQGGGIPSLAITGLGNFFANYEKGKHQWTNTLDLAYGTIRQGDSDAEFVKSEDRIDLTSKYGYRLSPVLLASTLLNFRTQFDIGFEFPEGPTGPRNYISQTLAPGYINWGIGLDYQPNEDFSVYFSPVNSKTTIVLDTTLSTLYMPADFAGEEIRVELGTFLNLKYRTDVMENVTFQTKADFFTNYLENFGNVDVNWENLLAFQVNKYITTTFFTHLIYDDDIRFAIDENEDGVIERRAPRTQFKHVLSIGLTYTLKD